MVYRDQAMIVTEENNTRNSTLEKICFKKYTRLSEKKYISKTNLPLLWNIFEILIHKHRKTLVNKILPIT